MSIIDVETGTCDFYFVKIYQTRIRKFDIALHLFFPWKNSETFSMLSD